MNVISLLLTTEFQFLIRISSCSKARCSKEFIQPMCKSAIYLYITFLH
nr:MAG TPA: hypothetical protein [Bacteriophage sp.]